MNIHNAFALETLVDFPDDALTCEHPITAQHLDSMMATLAALGIRRVGWAYYGDGHGGFFLPAGISGQIGDPSIGFDQNQWNSYAQTLDILGNPLRVAVEAAHRHGLELYAYFKPYEMGVALYFPEGSPQAREWGRLPHRGGYLSWMDPFVLQNPHLRIQRRSDDLWPGSDTATIHTLRLTKKDDTPTRVSKEHLQIWTCDLNHRYRRVPLDCAFAETIEPSPREVRDVYGNLLTQKGAPVRTLTLSGLAIDHRYIVVTTDFTDGPGDFENAWDRIVTAFDAQGREIPCVFATGTAIWFPEWEDIREGGLIFDTGRGPEAVALDAPNRLGVHREPVSTASGVHHLPGQRKVSGCIALTRGRNAYLPGGLCETEPEVQAYWLCCIREMLDAGVDGIDLRVENHSCHTDTPQDYGFNACVLQQIPLDSPDVLASMARVRGDAYTSFLRAAKSLIAARGKRMRINLNFDWFRPPAERPGSRKLAYPANIEFQWRTWVEEGLLDEAVLRQFALPFSGIFGADKVAQEMIAACRARNMPIAVNRYIWANPELLQEFQRVYDDGRFSGFIFYETWSYLQFTADGHCAPVGRVQEPDSKDAPELWQRRSEASARVQQVCRHQLSTLSTP